MSVVYQRVDKFETIKEESSDLYLALGMASVVNSTFERKAVNPGSVSSSNFLQENVFLV